MAIFEKGKTKPTIAKKAIKAKSPDEARKNNIKAVLDERKRKEINNKLNKTSKGSVKVVAPTADAARATANKKEELRLKAAKSGLAAKNTAAAKESMYKKVPKPKTVIKINSGGMGLTGARGGSGIRGPLSFGGGGAFGKIK